MKKLFTSSMIFLILTTAVYAVTSDYANQKLEAEVVEILQEIEDSLPEGTTLVYEEIETSSTLFSSEIRIKNPSLIEQNTPASLIKQDGDVIIGKNIHEKTVWMYTTGSTEISSGVPLQTVVINSPIQVTVDLADIEEEGSNLLETVLSSFKNVKVGFGKGSVNTSGEGESTFVTFDEILGIIFILLDRDHLYVAPTFL